MCNTTPHYEGVAIIRGLSVRAWYVIFKDIDALLSNGFFTSVLKVPNDVYSDSVGWWAIY